MSTTRECSDKPPRTDRDSDHTGVTTDFTIEMDVVYGKNCPATSIAVRGVVATCDFGESHQLAFD